MARRKDHTREDLRNLILEAAWKIVADEGVSALTARRLAADIGYAAGTIYNVFPSMDDLLLHINGKTLILLLETLNHPSCHATTNTPLTNMKMMAARYVDFATIMRPFWKALFLENIEESRYEEAWYKDRVEAVFRPLENCLETLLPHLSEDTRKLHAHILWSSVHGLTFLSATGKLPESRFPNSTNHMIDCLIENYIKGITL
mgnify:CR=1 FL=1